MRFAAVYMAEGLGKAGQIADALDAIDDAIARAELDWARRQGAQSWERPL